MFARSSTHELAGADGVQVNQQHGAADIITRAPHSVFCQLQHIAAQQTDPTRGAQSAAASSAAPARHLASSPQEASDLAPSSCTLEQRSVGSDGGSASCAHCKVALMPVADAQGSGTAVEMTHTSEYGVQRTLVFRSCEDVAQHLLRSMEDAPADLRAPFRDIRVGAKAALLLLTWHRYQAMGKAGAPQSEAAPLSWGFTGCPWHRQLAFVVLPLPALRPLPSCIHARVSTSPR